jgi:hypothetical protein
MKNYFIKSKVTRRVKRLIKTTMFMIIYRFIVAYTAVRKLLKKKSK